MGGNHGSPLLSKLPTATLLSMSVVERRSLVLRGVLDLCLLALLRDRPVYGYELTQRLAEQDLLVSGGSTYPLLARLEKAGLVVTEMRPSSSGPPRKYYSLSNAGAEALEGGTTEWLAVSTSVTALLQSSAKAELRTDTP
ncbi:PadR family transcriptional regulator PadR [Rhodococcus sp. OK302]|nr:PadR family transcriptional regulator PadR [Rhodococcus sp. OK302]